MRALSSRPALKNVERKINWFYFRVKRLDKTEKIRFVQTK